MSRIVWLGTFILLVATLVGCDSNEPKLYKVVGKVMMDGKPLPDAEVRFLPIPKGNEPVRPSSATTDENGEYSLEYSTTKSGARPGSYQVFVSTKRSAMPEVPAVPESVPDVYNTKTTLTAEIDEESRTFNFDLKSSEGKVPEKRIPPQPE
jgi:hypothetical protein